MNRRVYPKYKPSGIKWLEEIPEQWQTTRLRAIGAFSASGVDKKTVPGEPLVSMINYIDIYANPARELRRDRDYMIVSCPESKVVDHTVRTGDILFTPSSETTDEIGFSAVVMEDLPNTVYSYHVIRFRPRVEIDLKFRKYMCHASEVLVQFAVSSKGTTRQILTRDDFKNFSVCLPPPSDQRAIAHFLDRETAKIDALAKKKERLIELLQEKRAAIISQAVTNGLNPNVSMKDTGVEWLGKIPAHWEAAPLYARYEVALGKMLDTKRISGEYLAPYLRNVDVQWDRVNVDGLPEMDFASADRSRYALHVGDLLVCEGGEVGRTAMWAGELQACYYQKAVHRLRRIRNTDVSRFFYYVMYASAKSGRFVAGGNPNTIDHLTAIQLKQYRFAFPPNEEQRAIAVFLDNETGKIDALIAKVRQGIEKLKEYRTVLISAAVTGKIDVREGVAGQ